MMSSSQLSLDSGMPLINAIRSFLDDLDFQMKKKCFIVPFSYQKNKLMIKVRNILAFVLCARKMLGNDVHNDNYNKDENLGSLMARIAGSVCRNAQEFHNLCLNLEGKFSFQVPVAISPFLLEMESFDREIHEGYITLSDYSRHSSPLMVGELMEIMDPILENLVDPSTLSVVSDCVDSIIALRENLTLLKIFVQFLTIRGVENPQLGDLLAHVEAVTMSACSVGLFTAHFDDWREEIPSRVSLLLEKINPIDPQVYETCIQALTSSRLARNVNTPTNLGLEYYDPIIVMKDFIDSLSCNLWKLILLKLDSRLVVFEKEELQLLYEGLRFLRTILKEHPNKFDKGIKDLIAVAICDAGIIIFSLYQKGVEIDLTLVDFLGRIKLIQAEVEGQVPETSKSVFPRTNELGFVDNLLDNLMELTHSRVPAIQQELVSLRSFLGVIVEFLNEHEELQTLWDHVMEVAYKMEFLIESLLVRGDFPDSLSRSFDSIMEDIRNINTVDALKLFDGKGQRIKVKKEIVATKSNDGASQNRALVIDDEVVGFDRETMNIIERLVGGSVHLQVVAIVGMGGLGKTTLATKVYNNPSIMMHFHIRSWCSVSQLFDRKKVLLEILSHIVPYKCQDKSEHDLAKMLSRVLKKRRYLICLDDVWDIEAWKALEEILPDDSNRSRILLTSQIYDVIPQAMVGYEPLVLGHLTEKESWELLDKKLFRGRGCPRELTELSMKIARSCKGLPLAITIVSGLLATMDLESWEEVLISLNRGSVSFSEPLMNVMELSYKCLPDYLKSCFLYFGVFQEYREVLVKNLIQLWIAEGFVHKIGSKSLEDVAMTYVNDLVCRSMIVVAKRRSVVGGVKACRMHKLLHDFCKMKARQENFFHLLQVRDDLVAFNEPCFARRLCIYSKLKDFTEAKLYCPRLRTLLLFFERSDAYRNSHDISFIPHIFKLLRVLDVREVSLHYKFPSAILLLVHLRYLAIRSPVEFIPPSIEKLSYLETFLLNSIGTVRLPDTLWKLQRLRHLCILAHNSCAGFVLPIENLDGSPDLNELDSFSSAIVDYWDIMEKQQLRKFPNIRKLRCKLFLDSDSGAKCSKIVVPKFLSRLESLGLRSVHLTQRFDFDLDLPLNLKKLTLSGFGLPWSRISTVGKLPNLEILKLLRHSFSGETWDVKEGEFVNLKFLKLEHLDIVRWEGTDDVIFPNLQVLVVQKCLRLRVIPCLEGVPTLEMIEVNDCPECVPAVEEVRGRWEVNISYSHK